MFPDLNEKFTIIIGKKEFQANLDAYGRIWINANMIKDCINMKPYQVVIFTKRDKNRLGLASEHSQQDSPKQ